MTNSLPFFFFTTWKLFKVHAGRTLRNIFLKKFISLKLFFCQYKQITRRYNKINFLRRDKSLNIQKLSYQTRTKYLSTNPTSAYFVLLSSKLYVYAFNFIITHSIKARKKYAIKVKIKTSAQLRNVTNYH